MLVQPHVPVRLDSRYAPFLDLEPDGIQRAHASALDLLVLFPATVVPPREVRVVVNLQSHADGGIQPFQVVVFLVFHQRVDRSVDKLDGSFHEGLVAGAADTGRQRCTAVMLRERREVLVQLGLVLVRMRHRRLQVVRHDGLRRPAVEVEGVLAGVDEILLLLAHYGFDIGELGAGEDGDEHFHGNFLPGLPVDDVQPVSGEVHVHPVSGLVFQVGDRGGLDEIHLQITEELALHVSVGMLLPIPLEDHGFRDALLPQHPGILRHLVHEFRVPVRLGLWRIGIRLLIEEAEQVWLVHRQDLLDGLAALVESGDVLLHGVP